MNNTLTVEQLKEKCLWVRRKALEMAVKANSGHVSTAMSQTEILVAMYYGGILRHDPKYPQWEGRDYFLLSKGQGGLGLYPILADRGYFPVEDLDDFLQKGSHLAVHCEPSCPGVEAVSGSLGHGLPIATGICQALKNDRKDSLVFCLTGDGELQEGSNWEALMFAGWHELNNLVLLVDRNGQNTLGFTDGETVRDGPGLKHLDRKLEAFGFMVHEFDGNDAGEVLRHLSAVRDCPISKPTAFIANTKKGKGLSCMENQRMWHYRVPSGKDLEQCWEDLKVPAEARPTPSASQTKHAAGMRDRFFQTLFEEFKKDKNKVLITADNGAPTMDQFGDLPGQFYQVGIAEQQMLGMAAGMALRGRQVWCYAIGPFVSTRVHEFAKLDVCAMNLPIALVGTGAGFSYDIMSVSHHNVEDLAIMRALPNMTIFSPSDGNVAERVARRSANLKSPQYIRLDRGGVEDIGLYKNQNHELSKALVPRWGERARLAIVTTGIMTHQAIKVAHELDARVVDVCQVNPFPSELLFEGVYEDGCGWLNTMEAVVTLEEHQLNGGLGGAMAEAMVDRGVNLPLLRLGVPNTFTFELGGREVIWEKYGLDVKSLTNRIAAWQNSLGSCCGGKCCDLEQ